MPQNTASDIEHHACCVRAGLPRPQAGLVAAAAVGACCCDDLPHPAIRQQTLWFRRGKPP